jgi:hypothetical protein
LGTIVFEGSFENAAGSGVGHRIVGAVRSPAPPSVLEKDGRYIARLGISKAKVAEEKEADGAQND